MENSLWVLFWNMTQRPIDIEDIRDYQYEYK